jgi:hypothetical protein
MAFGDLSQTRLLTAFTPDGFSVLDVRIASDVRAFEPGAPTGISRGGGPFQR